MKRIIDPVCMLAAVLAFVIVALLASCSEERSAVLSQGDAAPQIAEGIPEEQNPAHNPVINPENNPVVNPKDNPVINPTSNPVINPKNNPVINPKNNPVVNPSDNPVINPEKNPVLDPTKNPAWTGYKVFDLEAGLTGQAVRANDEVLVSFAINLEWDGYFVSDSKDGYNWFDTNGEWKGYLANNSQEGYNLFSIDGDWEGFLALKP